jgi:hypothetical protein
LRRVNGRLQFSAPNRAFLQMLFVTVHCHSNTLKHVGGEKTLAVLF